AVRNDAVDTEQQSRLTGSIEPEEGDIFTWVDSEIDVSECGRATRTSIGERDILELDDRLRGRLRHMEPLFPCADRHDQFATCHCKCSTLHSEPISSFRKEEIGSCTTTDPLRPFLLSPGRRIAPRHSLQLRQSRPVRHPRT